MLFVGFGYVGLDMIEIGMRKSKGWVRVGSGFGWGLVRCWLGLLFVAGGL